MHSRRNSTDRLPGLVFGILVLITIAVGFFIHAVSPLRDPSYVPHSYNAGSLIPWLRWVSEDHWTTGVSILAGLLASSITVLTRQKVGQSRRSPLALLIKRKTPQIFQKLCWFTMGTVMHLFLMIGFHLYLFYEWIVD